MKMSIGSFLIDRLVSLGVSRIYGVPGDFNLEFLELLENSKRLSFVGTCNELNAAYSSRRHGRNMPVRTGRPARLRQQSAISRAMSSC